MKSLKGQKIFAKQRGFTLVEMAIALVLIGTLTALAFPSLQRSVDRFRLWTAARELAGNIRYLQQEAVNGKSTTIHMTFDTVNHYYVIVENAAEKKKIFLPPGFTFGSVTFSDNTLRFTIDGAPSGGGGYAEIVSPRGDRYQVVVAGATGRVQIKPQTEGGG
ncbi:prepilin-type N-terminal cleavage/methylation domain-containing protein [Calderihabitans maritimus]|uniref:Prepilin-type N-terminal cleavage/methylation domain-containing protein n=1 Tax=Calderihabitans maritimus TaxID=1246530 RepID=A0A1Z5HXU2_9FIRM|nr:prepilin-type N-terminal cleavage/methylation domain-containing protein [Calderihabitans maritimus]GAW94135.1 hypothetical protein Dtox_2705 [Calderihabitans maritimus]